MTQFQPGDVVLAADSNIYTRLIPTHYRDPEMVWVDGGWLINGHPGGLEMFREEDIPRPLILLVRKGKRVETA